MAESTRIKVTLRWVQILDKKEPFYKDRGEFFFMTRVKGDAGAARETRIPEKGHFEIDDHPSWNKVNFDRVIFEGAVSQRLEVELIGEEIDLTSPNDRLEIYHRVFTGNPASWVGEHTPHDRDHEPDPENLKDWRVCYRIDLA